jgi:hypothetical protein
MSFSAGHCLVPDGGGKLQYVDEQSDEEELAQTAIYWRLWLGAIPISAWTPISGAESSWRQPVNLLEVADKVAWVTDADTAHDLFDTQECRLAKLFSPLHPESFNELGGRSAGFNLEDVPQPGIREIYRLRKLMKRDRSMQFCLHEYRDFLNATVH